MRRFSRRRSEMPELAHAVKATTYAGDAGPKERIFHAAMSVALRNGFGKVALSLVAREAGLSKGGLLYHFASKNDLIRGMLEFYADPAARYAILVRPDDASASACECDPLAIAVLIAAAENPSLLETVRKQLGPEPLPDRLPLMCRLVEKFSLAAPAYERERGRPLVVPLQTFR